MRTAGAVTCALCTCSAAAAAAGSVRVTLTTTDQRSLYAPQPSISLGAAPAVPTVRVDAATAYQRMVGFGAAITDASAFVLHTSASLDEGGAGILDCAHRLSHP
jgi:glucosylceramidase